jgi:hypothetical protein
LMVVCSRDQSLWSSRDSFQGQVFPGVFWQTVILISGNTVEKNGR